MTPAPFKPAEGGLAQRFARLAIHGGYWFVVLAGVVSLLLTLGVWQWLSIEQRGLVATEFGLRADQRAEAIKRQFSSETTVVTALQAYYGGSEAIGQRQFEAFCDTFLTQQTSVDSVQWVPNVPADQRRAWETKGTREVAPDYAFKEASPQGVLTPAGQREAP